MMRPIKPSGKSLRTLVTEFKRADGKRGLRAREMMPAMHMAYETIQVALDQPERLCIDHLFALSVLLGMSPAQLVADVTYQVSMRQQLGLLVAGSRVKRATGGGSEDATRASK